MQIFLDTANVKEIKELVKTGIIDGVTTNPTHLAQETDKPIDIIKKLAKIVPGDISVEVTEKKPDKIYTQAKKIAKIAKNIVVKIPCHADYYPVIKKLVHEKIQINVTLVFSLVQALFMCKLGVKYISPFIGRLDDIDTEGIQVLYNIRDMIDNYGYQTKIIAASIRSVRNLHESITAIADVVTLPIPIFERAIKHPLTNQGIEKFLADWKKIGIIQFP